MAKKRVAMELGMGTSLRQQDYTKAAVRALQDAQMYDADLSDLEQDNVESLEEWIKKLRKPTLN